MTCNQSLCRQSLYFSRTHHSLWNLAVLLVPGDLCHWGMDGFCFALLLLVTGYCLDFRNNAVCIPQTTYKLVTLRGQGWKVQLKDSSQNLVFNQPIELCSAVKHCDIEIIAASKNRLTKQMMHTASLLLPSQEDEGIEVLEFGKGHSLVIKHTEGLRFNPMPLEVGLRMSHA